MANDNIQDEYERQMGDLIADEKEREQIRDELWRSRLQEMNSDRGEVANSDASR